MNRIKITCLAILMLPSLSSFAGGLLTNTNQNVAFLRNPARDAAISIDGVYSNPAGVVFMPEGLHMSLNFQNAHQTRNITSTFEPYKFGEQNEGNTTKEFKGKANAPVIPSIQAAYNKGKWSFQANFAITGGGGKCEFDQGLSSFESTVGMLPLLSQNMNTLTTALGMGNLNLPTVENYDMDTYMKGRQYYFGLTLGTAYKIDKHWSIYGGLRVLYGNSNYYGYVSNIRMKIAGSDEYVNSSKFFTSAGEQAIAAYGQYTTAAQTYAAAGNTAAAQSAATMAKDYFLKGAMLSALGDATKDVTLNCNQTGWGVAPIVGVDYKTGTFNFAAKYEFKTRMRLKNESANSESAKNLQILDRWADGINIADDSPALLTLGASWEAIPKLHLNAGWHHYFDKDATQFDNRQRKLGGDTNEYLFGAEYDINKIFEVSAGTQITRYNFTDDYMEDVSFNVSSYSIGFGFGIHLNRKMKLNVAYFQTNYSKYNRSNNDYYNLSSLAGNIIGNVATTLGQDQTTIASAVSATQAILTTPGSDGKSLLYGHDTFTRTNRVLGIGLDIDF